MFAELAPGLGWNLLMSLAIAIGVQVVLWWVSERTKDATIADVWWGTGFACIALATWFNTRGLGDDLRRGLLTALTVIWGARLSIYIHARSRGRPEDHRYAAYRRQAKEERRPVAWVMFRKVFGIQGLMMWITSIPVQVGQFLPGPVGTWAVIGATVWAIGLGVETVADAQLARFKADPANRGRPLATGLWRYSRHPNYFGDALVWWGLFLICCDHWIGWLTIFAPLRMTYRLGYRASLKLLETNLVKGRPEYADYVARTNRFFPWFPRARTE